MIFKKGMNYFFKHVRLKINSEAFFKFKPFDTPKSTS
jgi:hypothetical protein